MGVAVGRQIEKLAFLLLLCFVLNLMEKNKLENFFEFEKSRINITIFADERKDLNNQWDYLCLLIIPTIKLDLSYNKILDIRKIFDYDGELKFTELDPKAKGTKFKISESLIKELLNDTNKIYYFKIFGIDKLNINSEKFGVGQSKHQKYANIYNRFFRTNILQLKGYFKNKIVEIDNIYHDNEGNLEKHDYFDWHTIFKIEQDDSIVCNCDKIKFINSNHNLENLFVKESHFIQLVDILIGSITQCIEYHNKKNKSQIKLAELVLPYCERILEQKWNKNSSFKYYGRFDIQFFPRVIDKRFLTDNFKDFIYKERPLLIKQKLNKKEMGLQPFINF